jgi:23S rRNA (uracil1939-C5)-methyltransferase
LRPGERHEVVIERLGAAGDGIARAGGATLFVPLALAGERWRVVVEARLGEGWLARGEEALETGERAEPPCPVFGRCGGCRLQHLPPVAYAGFKRQRVVEALARRGLGDVPVAAPMVSGLGSRRRIRLLAERQGKRVRLG